MVHGSNVSAGCFAMTDPGIEEIYTMVASALANGQESVPVQIYPFVPTVERMHRERSSPHIDFWLVMRDAWLWTEQRRAPAPYLIKGKALIAGDKAVKAAG